MPHKSALAFLGRVARESGHQIDTAAAHREISDEVSAYRKWLAAKGRTKDAKKVRATKSRRSTYQKLSKSLDQLQRVYHEAWHDISDDVFLGMNLVEPSEVDDVWTNVAASLEWHRRLIGAASKFSPCRGRRRGSRLTPLIIPLIDIFERHTGTNAAVNRSNGGGKPYGKIIDFTNSVIDDHGLAATVRKPSAKRYARNPNAVGNIDETIAQAVYERRDQAPGRLMSLWRPE